jgi:hypothetical protein
VKPNVSKIELFLRALPSIFVKPEIEKGSYSRDISGKQFNNLILKATT